MAGTINRDDIAAVRERAPIEDIIGHHVALKPAGVGSVKGLCPFHDERSPSFHVRPGAGRWHCFGCGEGGDIIEFVMRMDGLTFVEAVESLAERAGVTLRYEDGGGPRREGTSGQRKRLLEAHRVAATFYQAQLSTPEAQTARTFLTERGFGQDDALTYGLGYAPQGWSHLVDHLRGKNFTEAELQASGLASQGSRGLYDRFRGRLLWPIRDVAGEVIGFGARKLYEDDQGPKYLNTPETPLYKKSQVLYGLDLAKTAIRQQRTVVVVEGYTDVMACHLAGVDTAVATCGTAFGEDHVKVVRRLMGDTGSVHMRVGASAAKVVFTFDGDEAGQNAALKSFALDQHFLAQTFVAVDPEGMDPCDIRQHRGDQAVVDLMAARVPLYEFVIKTALAAHDLETPEGQVAALRASAPVVAGIRDKALQPAYARRLAGWLGIEANDALAAVRHAERRGLAPGRGQREPDPSVAPLPQEPPPVDDAPPGPSFDPTDPVVLTQRQALQVLIQSPAAVTNDARAWQAFRELEPQAFSVPQYRAAFDAIMAAGGPQAAGTGWADAVTEQGGPTIAPLVAELAVSPLPHHKNSEFERFARSVIAGVVDLHLTAQIAQTKGRMTRAGMTTDEGKQAFAELIALEERRRELRNED